MSFFCLSVNRPTTDRHNWHKWHVTTRHWHSCTMTPLYVSSQINVYHYWHVTDTFLTLTTYDAVSGATKCRCRLAVDAKIDNYVATCDMSATYPAKQKSSCRMRSKFFLSKKVHVIGVHEICLKLKSTSEVELHLLWHQTQVHKVSYAIQEVRINNHLIQ
jgi:hypothetical protein